MPRGYVAERDGGPERDAPTGVVAAHDARRVVAHRIEARYRPPVFGEHLRVLVAAKPREGAEIANDQLDRVERPLPDRRNARIGPVVRIAERAVVGRRAFGEFRIFPVFGMLVEILDGAPQPSEKALAAARARSTTAVQRGGRRKARTAQLSFEGLDDDEVEDE